MRKIPTLYRRADLMAVSHGDAAVADVRVAVGCEWVADGEGVATVQIDGTACMVRGNVLYKRYDRRPSKAARRRGPPYSFDDAKDAPAGWVECEVHPDETTGHWPGWTPVGDGPEDRWFREAFGGRLPDGTHCGEFSDGTYELVGPKVQGNPYGLEHHMLVTHGSEIAEGAPRDPEGLRRWLEGHAVEGIVWHHPDGRMAKLKRRDFDLRWPVADWTGGDGSPAAVEG